MRRLLLALPPILFLTLAALFALQMERGTANDMPSVFVGKPAPSIAAAALADFAMPVQADLATGKVTIVNFWASWCPPCRAEHPTLKALSAEGIQVIGVNMMDREVDALGFLDAHGNPFAKIAFDPKGKTRLEWGVTAPPETFILNGKGKVLFRYIGPLIGDDYLQRFRPALDKALAGN